ncbi:Hypothetical protein POVR1_LOCUS571 [uncultured virus]|nr:Hypothetical protein POVR1_LOCUS571 [uncultured virus]
MSGPVSCSSGPVQFAPTSDPNISTAVLPFDCPNFPRDIANTYFNNSYTVRFVKTVSRDPEGDITNVTIVGSIVATGGQAVYSFTLVVTLGTSLGPYPQFTTSSATSSAPPTTFPPPAPPGIVVVPGSAGPSPNYMGPYTATVTWHPIPNVNLAYTFNFTSTLSATNPAGELFNIVQGTVTTVVPPQVVLFQAQIDPSDETPPIGQTSVPQIDIIAYSSLNQENLGEVQFTVRDIVSYKCLFLPPESKNERSRHECTEQFVSTSEVVTTIFVESPDLNLVVEGKGCTLQQKINYLRVKCHIDVDESMFMGNVIAFGLLKYILARLMYGDFNLKYLLRSFNNQFFRDLEKSRFCLFVDAFIELGLAGYARFYRKKVRLEKFDCCCSNNAVEPCKENS